MARASYGLIDLQLATGRQRDARSIRTHCWPLISLSPPPAKLARGAEAARGGGGGGAGGRIGGGSTRARLSHSPRAAFPIPPADACAARTRAIERWKGEVGRELEQLEIEEKGRGGGDPGSQETCWLAGETSIPGPLDVTQLANRVSDPPLSIPFPHHACVELWDRQS